MLRRKAYDELTAWKERPGHKSLLVSGQRQVGKTFIITEFGKANYEHMVYADLSSDARMRDAFDESTVDGILASMKLYRDPQDFVPGSTLILLDEIQSCPRARSALKLFTMDGRYDVIASGSLPGVRNPVRRRSGRADPEDERRTEDDRALVLPAGYEDHMTMRSLDFEEFLWACSFPQEAIDEVRRSIRERTPLDDGLLRAVNARFRDFMIVGGMPRAVATFVASGGDYAAAGREVSSVMGTCLNDVFAYNPPVESARIRECLMSIPEQLSRGSRRFVFSQVPSDGSRGTRATYDPSILWISQAGYVNLCYNLVNLAHPLSAYTDRTSFKAYMSDTGMLNSMMGIESIRAVHEGDYAYNMGAVVENSAAEGIMKSGVPVRHYIRTDNSDGRRMEVDFVAEFGRDILAIEVKSGRTRDSPSLKKAARVFDQVSRRVMLDRGNVRVDGDGVEHYPLFAAHFIDMMAEPYDGPEFVAYDGMRAASAVGRRGAGEFILFLCRLGQAR